MSKTVRIRYLKDGLYGGWDKGFAHGVQDKRVFRRIAGQEQDIDEGAIDSPVLKQLVTEGCIQIISVDDVPGDSPYDKSSIVKDITRIQGAQYIFYNVAIGASQTLNHSPDPDFKRVTQALKAVTPLGTNLALAMTSYDPNNYSTFDNNVNDGNLLNFWYNNSSVGSAGKWIGLDNGSPITVTHAKWYDYSATSIYQPTQYRIEGSNNGSTWTTLVDISSPPYLPSTTSDGHLVDLGGSQTYRYFRWYCVTGNNPTYVIIAELELYNVTDPDIWTCDSSGCFKVEYLNETQTRITNDSGSEQDVLVNILLVDKE